MKQLGNVFLVMCSTKDYMKQNLTTYYKL